MNEVQLFKLGAEILLEGRTVADVWAVRVFEFAQLGNQQLLDVLFSHWHAQSV